MSCTGNSGNQEQLIPAFKTGAYSNLVDDGSRGYVKEALEKAGIPSGDVTTFFGQVDFFNESVEQYGLIENGFGEVVPLEPAYDPYRMQELWDAANPDFMGYNCRITSYVLMKNLIDIGQFETEPSDMLIFDLDAIDSGPKNPFTDEEVQGFITLYHSVATDDSQDLDVHLKAVKEYWNSKQLSFKSADASLISVFFHEEDGFLFIGHVGVLVPGRDGNLIFAEKVAFQEPYQAIRFANRSELNYYLMKKYDNSWGQETIPPFIMENDELMEGYKALSNQ